MGSLAPAWVPPVIQSTAGNSDPAASVAATQKSYLNKLNALNAPLNRKPLSFLQPDLWSQPAAPHFGGPADTSLAPMLAAIHWSRCSFYRGYVG
jgi:hypothetical protein